MPTGRSMQFNRATRENLWERNNHSSRAPKPGLSRALDAARHLPALDFSLPERSSHLWGETLRESSRIALGLNRR